MLSHHYERNIFHLFGLRFEEYIGSCSIPFLGGGKFHDRNLFTVFSLRCIQRHSSREGAIPRFEERKQATRIDLISTSRIPIHPLWLKFESIPGRHRVGNRPPCFVESVTILLPPLPAKNPIYTRTRVEDLVRWGGGNNAEHPWNVARNRYGLRPLRLEAQPAARGMCV